MKGKNFVKLFASCAMACSMFFAGCGDKPADLNQTWNIEAAYIRAQEEGFKGTFEEFLEKLTDIGDISVNSDGQLIIVLGDGTVVNAGTVKGADGRDGVDGEDGKDGKDGKDGVDGIDGVDGKDGKDGVDGIDGVDGKDGKDGVDGKDGKDGKDGVDGTNGKDGVDGEKGETGRVGFVVTSAEQLMVAVTVPHSYVVLACDINTDQEIKINATSNLDFVLDLNGHKITKTTAGGNLLGIRTVNTDYTVDAIIMDGEFTSIDNKANYGIFVNGNNVNLYLENVKSTAIYSALITNGNSYDGALYATGCEFVATSDADGSGAYLPANYVYEFVDTEFTGYDGISIKSGTHTYTDCMITANGTEVFDLRYYGNGFEVTGSAFVVNSCDGYLDLPPMDITLDGCEITSENGYGILVGETAKAGEIASSYLNNLVVTDCAVSGKLASSNISKTLSVTNYDQLVHALSINEATIILENDIETTECVSIHSTSDLKFTLDLNNHKIIKTTAGSNIIRVKTMGTDYSIDAVIKNGELTSTNNAADYGLFITGTDINLELTNLKSSALYSGIITNGNSYNGSIYAENCEFVAVATDDGAGAYLPANYTYEFVNTSFTGYDGVYIKSGTHTYTGCEITANGVEASQLTYYGNGFVATGSALVIDSCDGYIDTPPMNISLVDCTIVSENAYGILIGKTAQNSEDAKSYLGELYIDQQTTITSKLNKIFNA